MTSLSNPLGGRQACDFSKNNGTACLTSDCSGKLECTGLPDPGVNALGTFVYLNYQPRPGIDYGYSLQITSAISCPIDFASDCPSDLQQVTFNGSTLQCEVAGMVTTEIIERCPNTNIPKANASSSMSISNQQCVSNMPVLVTFCP